MKLNKMVHRSESELDIGLGSGLGSGSHPLLNCFPLDVSILVFASNS